MIHATYKKADIILVLGLSAVYSFILNSLKKQVILNPDGAEWKRAKWNFLYKIFKDI